MGAVRRAEVLILFAWNFCAVGAFFVGRTVRDAIFLATESPARLPLMYVASPIVLALVGALYARFAHRVRRDKLVVATTLTFAVLLVAVRVALGPRWLTYALYAGVEVMGALAMMQFWGTAGERFTTREAKRVFGKIAAGGTVANIVLGLGVSALVVKTGAENLLLMCAVFMVLIAGFARVLAARPVAHAGIARGVAPAREAAPKGPAPGTRHLVIVGPMIVCAVVATLLVDFQFKRLATESWGGDRVAMVRFFGLLSAGTGVLALLLQLFVTGRLLARVGVAGALLVLPSTLGIGAVMLLVAPSLVAATVGKAADSTFRYTVHDAGMQLLYLPVPVRVRGPKKAFLDGVVKPTTEALAGAALWAYRTSGGARLPLAIAAVGFAAAWAYNAARLRGAYAGALADTLRRRVLGGDVEDPPADDVARACRAAFASGDEKEILAALDVARLAPAALVSELGALAADPRPAVRAGALHAFAEGALVPDAAVLAPGLVDVDADVRAAAARLAAPATARGLLDDASSAVVAAAAEALAKRGGPEDHAAVRARIERLLATDDRRARRLGVRVAGAVGAPAIPTLTAALAVPERAVHAARALAVIGGADAVAALAGALAADDESTRAAAAHALARLRRDDPFAPLPEDVLRRAIQAELERATWAIAAAEGLGHDESALQVDGTRARVPYLPHDPAGPTAVLSRTLRERMERARDRALALCDALTPGRELDVIAANLRDPDPARRANAVELLETRVDGALRAPLVALSDETARVTKLDVLAKLAPPPRHARGTWVKLLLDDPSPWMRTCATSYAAAHALPHPPDEEAAMIRTTERVMFLKGLELFATVPGDDLAEVAQITDEVTLDEGEILFREGERGDALYLVVDGTLRVEHDGRTLATLGTREVVGEMALLDPAPRSATCVAATPARLLRLSADTFAALLVERPEVASGVLRILTRRLRAASRPE